MRAPSLEEQDAAARYVRFHPLPRPRASIARATVFALLFALVNVAISFALHKLSGLAPLMSAAVVFAVTGIVCLRPAVIGCVRLYQHYAKESTRRRCLCRPTCSEYAILAVKKYGAIIGFAMSLYRVLRKCRGSVYRIDYP